MRGGTYRTIDCYRAHGWVSRAARSVAVLLLVLAGTAEAGTGFRTMTARGEFAGAAQLPPPPPGRHGMLVLGTQEDIYFLHLAVRSPSPHQFQLIMKTRLVDGGDTGIGDRTFVDDNDAVEDMTVEEVYFADRNHVDNDVELYTFRPTESFVLTEIPARQRVSFVGDIVRGHFEDLDADPPSILTSVQVDVVEILYFEDLRKPLTGTHPRDEGRLEFLLFGGGEEFFLDHRITLDGTQNADDDNAFHQVFRLTPGAAARMRFSADRNVVGVQLSTEEATAAGRLPTTGGSFGALLLGLVAGSEATIPVTLDIGPEHYLEVLF